MENEKEIMTTDENRKEQQPTKSNGYETVGLILGISSIILAVMSWWVLWWLAIIGLFLGLIGGAIGCSKKSVVATNVIGLFSNICSLFVYGICISIIASAM